MTKAYQIETDGKTVWVNGADGMCLARYGPKGIDVHHTTERQIAGDTCFACRARSDDPDLDWAYFKERTQAAHGIFVPERMKPK